MEAKKMIIQIISTQGTDENGQPLTAEQDINALPQTERKQYIKYLKRNEKAGLLKWRIIEK